MSERPEAKTRTHRPAAKQEPIDYEKLSGMVADKLSTSIIMSRGKEVDTRDTKVEQVNDIRLDGSVLSTNSDIVLPDGPVNNDYLSMLAFMEEEMEIIVAETSDENAENPVTVGCNGQFRQFFRGNPTITQRKFVDCLIVKTGRVTTPEVQVPGVGGGSTERSFSIRQQSAHKYPFTVLRDPNPKGPAWLQQRLATAI